MSSPEGLKYLQTEDEFLPQIVKSFAQLDPVWLPFLHPCSLSSSLQFNGQTDSAPIFSKKRVEETLTSGYLEMLGTLSKQKDGLECVTPSTRSSPVVNVPLRRLLEKFKIFTAFYHMSELRSREDLIKLIVENLDYSM